MKNICVILSVLISNYSYSQTVVSIAGTGSSTYSGEGVPATSAGMNNPRGGAFDKLGNYYFADGLGVNRIRKIDTFNFISTVAGNGVTGFGGDSGLAIMAKLNGPVAVALDSGDNIYIADIGNNRVRKVDRTSGIISTVVGNGTAGHSGDGFQATNAAIDHPDDLCFDKNGNLYISCSDNSIRKVNLGGIISTIAGTGFPASTGDGGPATDAQINGPTGVAVDDSNNVYIAERGGNRIRKINSSGIITTYAGNGLPTYIGDGIPATSSQIVPIKIRFSPSHLLVVASDYNERIFSIDNSGIIHSIAGTGIQGFSGDGGLANLAEFNRPLGVAFDKCGNLYVPEVGNFRIRKVIFEPPCSMISLSLNFQDSNFRACAATFPNPTFDEFCIDNAVVIGHVTVSDIFGKLILSREFDSKKVNINIGFAPEGIYFVKVTDVDGKTTISKIIKQ